MITQSADVSTDVSLKNLNQMAFALVKWESKAVR